jgi:hypothetical protein
MEIPWRVPADCCRHSRRLSAIRADVPAMRARCALWGQNCEKLTASTCFRCVTNIGHASAEPGGLFRAIPAVSGRSKPTLYSITSLARASSVVGKLCRDLMKCASPRTITWSTCEADHDSWSAAGLKASAAPGRSMPANARPTTHFCPLSAGRRPYPIHRTGRLRRGRRAAS